MPSSMQLRGVKVRRTPLLATLAAAVAAASLAVAGLSGDPAAPAASSVPAGSTASSLSGAQWEGTPVPVKKGDITAVAALDEKQAWALGYRLNSQTSLDAVALRWDGTAWTQESKLPKDSFPQAMAVRSASDIWAVGAASEHWNGKTWTTHQLARDPAGRVVPDAVATTSDGKAWTVGRAVPGSIKDGAPAIQAWDGEAWQKQTLPDVGKGELSSVVALASDDVWAAGAAFAADEKGKQSALLLHWDGSDWKRVAAPGGDTGHQWIGGITALAPDDIWAVGGTTSGSADRPYAAHWDGKNWTVAKTPDIADGRLRAVGRTGDGELWAVGGKGAVSVALRWNAKDGQWDRAPDPGVVVRAFATVPKSADLWTVGIAQEGDLVPAITRLKN
ncbi:hypothetical protein ABZW18_13440 [Streptomyces sp. NPDC004647]|uniref:hypothetical protein n=1 Tax=Streptomyces sp. NPDC004647 TaxID=3154671 RepID=UPI0033AC9E17